MKTCWFFGDSFTRGDNCHRGDEYYEMTYIDGCKRWTELVSEHLNGIEKNCAWGGNSNQHILHELICNLINYKEGDWVIVGDTRPCRVINFEQGEVRNTISDSLNGYTKGTSESILNYIVDEIIPNEKEYEIYYQKMYISLLEFLKHKKINTLFWKHTDFWSPTFKLETIASDTNGKLTDGHYSWGAHKRKAEIIINRIDNPNKLL